MQFPGRTKFFVIIMLCRTCIVNPSRCSHQRIRRQARRKRSWVSFDIAGCHWPRPCPFWKKKGAKQNDWCTRCQGRHQPDQSGRLKYKHETRELGSLNNSERTSYFPFVFRSHVAALLFLGWSDISLFIDTIRPRSLGNIENIW